ncbi:MAG: enoyl-CoA hydratase, partial [Burkholderiales bacterium]|nr:enoyl-CoA hydratase [Burkholderiales bacterium]
MQDITIRVEQLGAVRRLWLARPAARNAQNQAMLDALDEALAAAAADDATRVVVLAGEGDHFSAGHDLKEAAAKRGTISVEQRYAYEERRYFEYCMRLRDFAKPTIAQVQGACVAGGFMLANMCDLIVAADDAYFSDPVGHTMGAAATEVLIHPWVMGLRQAKELLFTGGRLTAAQALTAGMVNHVVARAELDARTLELAERIAKSPPFAMKLIKRSLNRSQDMQGMREAMSAHFDLHQ